MDALHVELLELKDRLQRLESENATLRAQLSSSRELTDVLQGRMLMMTDDDVPESLRHGHRAASSKGAYAYTPLTSSQFRAEDVVITESKLTKAVELKLDNAPLIVQTPPMMCPFGMQDSAKQSNRSSRACVRFALRPGPGRLFQQQLTALEDAVKGRFLRSQPGLRFASCLGAQDGTLRTSVSLGECRAFDDKQAPLDVRTCLQAGNVVVAILRCNGVWFTDDARFGIAWSMLQVKRLSCAIAGLGQYAFRD